MMLKRANTMVITSTNHERTKTTLLRFMIVLTYKIAKMSLPCRVMVGLIVTLDLYGSLVTFSLACLDMVLLELQKRLLRRESQAQ